MTIRALSSTSVDLTIGAAWSIVVSVVDSSGCPADDTPTVTVTLPGGGSETPDVETVTTGVYRTTYLPAVVGRYVALVSSPTNGATDFAAYVAATTAELGMPTLDDVLEYLGPESGSWTEDQIQGALDAEAAAQRARCRVGAVYPDDLREALKRRVQRNLEMRRMPVGILTTSDGETVQGTRVGTMDPEIRRLEGPYRKRVVG